jgi:hypothetical protein
VVEIAQPTANGDRILGALHEDVLQAIERLSDLFNRADSLGVMTADGPDSETRLSLEAHFDSVRNLELLMPIVAPMKAGKSTLVNAIVGYQLLPSRANPMTTMPTKILLVDGLDITSPELRLGHLLRELFRYVESRLRAVLTTGWPVPEEHSYLGHLAGQIRSGTIPDLREIYTGADEVHQVLMRLNDEVRLAGLAIEDDVVGMIPELPVLRTGYLHDYAAGTSHGGQLVLIDTPGPNEQAIAARLGPVLESQLRRSHVVLVVLDYTQMGSDAAADVRMRLEKHLEIIGTSSIYAVVNKVDHRKDKKDLSVAETLGSVRHSLGLSEDQAAGQVFEVVANWGLIGSQVLADMRESGSAFDIANSDSARALLREQFPLDEEEDREERLSTMQSADLRKEAERCLRRSRVKDLMSVAITRLREGAAPAVIRSGLGRFEAALHQLDEVLALELSAGERDQELVADQLIKLKQEMRLLEDRRAKLPDVNSLRARYRADLNLFVGELQAAGRDIIASVGVPERREKATGVSAVPLVGRMVKSARKLTREIWPGQENDATYVVSTKAEAEKIIAKMTDVVVEQLREMLDWARGEMEQRVQAYTLSVVNEQEAVVREIVKRAAATLSVAFNVKLQVPPPAVVDGRLTVDLTPPTKRKKIHTEQYQDTVTRRTWYTLWIGKKTVTVTRTRDVEKVRFEVSRDDLVRQLTKTLDQEIEQIRSGLSKYVTSQLTERLQTYYDGLDTYLQRYLQALQRSQETSEEGRAAQQQRQSVLGDLRTSLERELMQLEEYRLRIPGSAKLGAAEGTASPV